MPVIDNLEIKATGDVKDALQKIDSLIGKFSALGNVLQDASFSFSMDGNIKELKAYASAVTRVKKAYDALGRSSEVVIDYRNLVPPAFTAHSIKAVSDSMRSLARSTEKAQMVFSNDFDMEKIKFPESAFQNLMHMANAYTDLEYAARKAYVAMEAAHNIGGLAVPQNIQMLTEAVNNLSGKVGDLRSNVSKTAKDAEKDVDESSQAIKKSVSKAVDHAHGKLSQLFSSIKRIIFYRAIRSAIKMVTQGFREGIENAYQWAIANQDAFQQVMDTYATKVLYLKNTMGALASTVLTALLPAFTWLVDKFVQAANWVNEFIAALTGQDSYLRAREVAVEYAEAVDGAAGAQKKLNQQLMAFDELNVITTPKDSGRGKDDAKDWMDAFERVNVSDKFNKVKVIGEKLRGIFAQLKEPLSKVKEFVGDIFDKVWNLGVPDDFSRAFQSIENIAFRLFQFVKKVVDKCGELGISETISKTFEKAGEIFDNILQTVESIIGKLDEMGISDAVASTFANFVDCVVKITSDAVINGLSSIENFFKTLDSLLSGDWEQASKSALETVLDIAKGIASPFTTIMDKVGDLIADLTGARKSVNYTQELENTINDIRDAIDKKGAIDRRREKEGKTGVSYIVKGRDVDYDTYWYLYDKYNAGVNDVHAIEAGSKGGSGSFGADNYTGTWVDYVADYVDRRNNDKWYGQNLLYDQDIDLRAGGGYPEMGSMFVAGEGGAEFVGNINGRTGVASGQEITGIADAVYATGNEEANLLRELVAIVRAGGGTMQPSAAFGRFASQSIKMYKGVTG